MTEKDCGFCNQLKNIENFSSSEQIKKKAKCRICVSLYDKNRAGDTKSSKCKDCELPCGKRSLRCQRCSNRIIGKSRPRNPKLCGGCGGELAKRKYKLCHSCNMKTRWADKEYKEKTAATMKAAFDVRWADPVIKKQIIKNLIDHHGTSKLEKRVARIGKLFGFEPSVAVGRYLADILNEKTKTIVEVNGDLWHCNPKFWKAEDIHPNKKVTAQVVWDRDLKRKIYLESLGYSIFVLWEDDIVKGKESFIRAFFEELNVKR